MTVRVNPSHQHPSWSDETAAAIMEGGGITGYIIDGVMLSDDDPDLDPTGITAFDASYTGNSVTVTGGEAFVYGAWVAIDVPTDVTISSDGTVLGVGWTKFEPSVDRRSIDTDAAVVQDVENFGPEDEYIPLWRVSFDGTANAVTGLEDLRLLQRPIYNDLQGKVYIPYNDLDMQGNNVINTGNLLEGDESLFVNRSGDDMFGPLEIVGDTPGGMTSPLTLRNDNTDSGTGTEIRMINSTSAGAAQRGAVLRSVRGADGGADLAFGIGDGSTVYESAGVNTDGMYADSFQAGNVTIEDDDTFRYNGTNYMSFDTNGITATEDLHVNTIIPDSETMINSTNSLYRFRVQGNSAMRFLDTHITSDKPHYFLDRVEIRNNGSITHPHITFENAANGNNVHMNVTISDDVLGDGVFHFSNSGDPATSVIRLDAVTGRAEFDGEITANSNVNVDGRYIRMSDLGGEGGLGIDNNTFFSSFEGWATMYNAADRGGQGWRMRDINGAGTLFEMNSAGEARFTNKLKVENELVLPKRTSRPSNAEVGTIIYRTDKDN